MVLLEKRNWPSSREVDTSGLTVRIILVESLMSIQNFSRKVLFNCSNCVSVYTYAFSLGYDCVLSEHAITSAGIKYGQLMRTGLLTRDLT